MKLELPEYGPCMMALTERKRRFVWALMANPEGDQADWAREAGYSDAGEGCKVRACENLQQPKVRAAIEEVSRSTLHGVGPALAVVGMLKIASNPKHKDYARAIEMIANRVGFGEKQEIEVTHRDLTGDALLHRLTALASRLGLDADKLLGENVGHSENVSREAVKVIEHSPAENRHKADKADE